MQPTSPLMGGFAAVALYQLDPATGAAELAKLKVQ